MPNGENALAGWPCVVGQLRAPPKVGRCKGRASSCAGAGVGNAVDDECAGEDEHDARMSTATKRIGSVTGRIRAQIGVMRLGRTGLQQPVSEGSLPRVEREEEKAEQYNTCHQPEQRRAKPGLAPGHGLSYGRERHCQNLTSGKRCHAVNEYSTRLSLCQPRGFRCRRPVHLLRRRCQRSSLRLPDHRRLLIHGPPSGLWNVRVPSPNAPDADTGGLPVRKALVAGQPPRSARTP